MNYRIHRCFVTLFLIAAVVAVPTSTFAQAAPVTANNWTAIQSLKLKTNVIVMTKDGVETKGKLQNVSETSMVLGEGRKAETLQRERIAVIFANRKSVGKSTTIGAAAGAISGLGLGVAAGGGCSAQDFVCFSRGELVTIAAPVFAIPGALVGFLIGESKHHRVLVYSAKP